MLKLELFKRGVSKGNIIHKRYTEMDIPESTSERRFLDAIAEKGRCYSLLDEIQEVKDHYPKYVVTMSSMDVGIKNGIKIVHLTNFLLEEKW